MSILSKYEAILSFRIEAVLESCDNPATAIDQCLIDALDNLSKVKSETAAVAAAEKRCKYLLGANEEDIKKYANLALRALKAGSEEDARAFIIKKQECQLDSITCQNAFDAAHTKAAKIQQMHDKLVEDINLLRMHKASLSAAVDDSLSEGEDITQSLSPDTSKPIGLAWQNIGPNDSAQALAEKYKAANVLSVDEELATLKAALSA